MKDNLVKIVGKLKGVIVFRKDGMYCWKDCTSNSLDLLMKYAYEKEDN